MAGRVSPMAARTEEATLRIGAALVLIWIVIGVIAAVQRGYFSSDETNCAEAGNTVVTIVAGPLNYFGVNPKIKCDLPEPSQ